MVTKKSKILPLWSFFEEGPKFKILYHSACLCHLQSWKNVMHKVFVLETRHIFTPSWLIYYMMHLLKSNCNYAAKYKLHWEENLPRKSILSCSRVWKIVRWTFLVFTCPCLPQNTFPTTQSMIIEMKSPQAKQVYGNSGDIVILISFDSSNLIQGRSPGQNHSCWMSGRHWRSEDNQCGLDASQPVLWTWNLF